MLNFKRQDIWCLACVWVCSSIWAADSVVQVDFHVLDNQWHQWQVALPVESLWSGEVGLSYAPNTWLIHTMYAGIRLVDAKWLANERASVYVAAGLVQDTTGSEKYLSQWDHILPIAFDKTKQSVYVAYGLIFRLNQTLGVSWRLWHYPYIEGYGYERPVAEQSHGWVNGRMGQLWMPAQAMAITLFF